MTMRQFHFGGQAMMRVIKFLLCMFLMTSAVRADIVADVEQRIVAVDEAIEVAENAWIKASAQVKVLVKVIDELEQDSREREIATRNQAELEGQVTQLSGVLDQLRAKRLELSWALSVYKKAVETKQLEAALSLKTNEYKVSYTAQIKSMSDQFKTIEDGIVQIKNILEAADFSDAKAVAASDAKGRINGAIVGLESALFNLVEIDTKITSDMPDIQKISAWIANDFLAWWKQQQDWTVQTKVALTNRKDVLKDFEQRLATKQQEYTAFMAKKAEVDAAAVVVQQKKTDALTIFKGLVEARAKIIQQMSDLVGVITSTLGTADQAIAAATKDEALGSILSQAQAATNNMIDVGEFQRVFSSTEDALSAASEQMATLFEASEIADIKQSITEQSRWMQSFTATLQALRDQSANVRKKLDDKKANLAQIIADGQAKDAAAYAASIQQLIQIITQVRSQASGVIRDVLTPLVLGVSQKIVALSSLFDAQEPSESVLKSMKTAIDEVSGDSAQVDASLKEFDLWAKMIDEYGAMIDQQLTDATLKTTLSGAKKDFADWKVWVSGVGSRQQAITKNIEMAKARYATLTDTAKNIKDASYALDLSLKQAQDSLDVLGKKKTPVDDALKKLSDVVEALAVDKDADGVLDQFKALITSLVDLESDTKKAQELIGGLLPSTSPRSVIDKYSAQVGKLKDAMNSLGAAVQKMRVDTDTLKDKATNKKTSLVAASAAAKEADVKKQAEMVAAQKAAESTAQSLAAFVGGAKKEVLDIAAFKKDLESFQARIDAAKTEDAVSAVVKDFSSSKDKFKLVQDAIKQLLADADKVQALYDADKAANRNIPSDGVQSLNDQKTLLLQAQKDVDAFVKVMDDTAKKVEALAGDVQKRASGLDAIKSQAASVAQKIKSFSAYLDRIKDAISSAQSTISSGTTAVDFGAALSKVVDAEKLKATITTEKASDLVPALDALTKTAVPNFTKSFGDLPADIAGDVQKQVAWVGAVDTSVNAFMDTIATLKTQLVSKRDQLSQDDLKVFGDMTFAKQLQALEDSVPNASAAAQVDAVMRKVEYVVKNRYGTKPEDKDPSVISGNKARLLRFIDWVLKNTRFASRKTVLTGYRKEVAA